MQIELPPHYRTITRRFIRFAAAWFVLGMIMGIVSTDYQRALKFTSAPNGEPSTYEEGGKTYTALPPGFNWEVSFDLRISHGHFVVIGSVIPLCMAATLILLHACGGKLISAGLLHAAFWLYIVGCVAALFLIFYKGIYLVTAVQDGNYDLAALHKSMFMGSRGLRGAAHALSHTILAAGMGVMAFGFWKSSETIRA